MNYILLHIVPPADPIYQEIARLGALTQMIEEAASKLPGASRLGDTAWLLPLEGAQQALAVMFQGSQAQHLRIRALLLEDPAWIELSGGTPSI